jgi:hypothetical protein
MEDLYISVASWYRGWNYLSLKYVAVANINNWYVIYSLLSCCCLYVACSNETHFGISQGKDVETIKNGSHGGWRRHRIDASWCITSTKNSLDSYWNHSTTMALTSSSDPNLWRPDTWKPQVQTMGDAPTPSSLWSKAVLDSVISEWALSWWHPSWACCDAFSFCQYKDLGGCHSSAVHWR